MKAKIRRRTDSVEQVVQQSAQERAIAFLDACGKFDNIKQYRSFLYQEYAKLYPKNPYPENVKLKLVKFCIAYTMIHQDMEALGMKIPPGVKQNYEASRQFDPTKLTASGQAFLNVPEKFKGEDSMKTATKVLVKKKPKQSAEAEAQDNQKKKEAVKVESKKKTVAQGWCDLFLTFGNGKKTDEQLAGIMKKEFPTGKKYTEADVRLHRSLYNRGKISCQKAAPKTQAVAAGE